jgi:hypothetical protein
MAEKLRSIFTLLILMSTTVVTVATSKVKDGDYKVTPDSLARKDYYVASNCPQAVPQERITVDNELVDYPTNRSFLNYGLPVYNLNLTYSSTITGNMYGRERSCTRSMQNYQGTPLIVYTCYENSNFLCQTTFEAVQ